LEETIDMKLYVGNLTYSASEEDLANWLAENGIATDAITLVRDRLSGESRGFGFIEINDPDEAHTMIHNCHGKQFMGRALVVSEARPKMQPRSASAPYEGEQGNRKFAGKRDDRRRESRW
jgi:RNA recognition motif-containing protein